MIDTHTEIKEKINEMKMFFFGLLAYFMVTSSIFECKSSKSEISDLNLILKDKTIDQILNELSRKNTRERNLRYASSSADGSEKRNEFESSILKIPHKRPRNTRKQKSLIHNGYSLDMNVENFKSLVEFLKNILNLKLF